MSTNLADDKVSNETIAFEGKLASRFARFDASQSRRHRFFSSRFDGGRGLDRSDETDKSSVQRGDPFGKEREKCLSPRSPESFVRKPTAAEILREIVQLTVPYHLASCFVSHIQADSPNPTRPKIPRKPFAARKNYSSASCTAQGTILDLSNRERCRYERRPIQNMNPPEG